MLQSCGPEENSGEGYSEVLPAVEAVQAQFGSLPLKERPNGIVRAANQVDIYPEISALNEEVFVQNGKSVSCGDVLVQLRDNEYRERLRQTCVFPEGGDEFPIRMRLQESDQMSTLDVENISVRSADSQTLPISTVIDQHAAGSPVGINRINGQRIFFSNR